MSEVIPGEKFELPTMSDTGLYLGFESSAGAISMALKNYIAARNNNGPQPEDLTPAEAMKVLRGALSTPVMEYVELLVQNSPNEAEEIRSASDPTKVVLVDAVVRTLNTRIKQALDTSTGEVRELDLENIAASLDRLHELVNGKSRGFSEDLKKQEEV